MALTSNRILSIYKSRNTIIEHMRNLNYEVADYAEFSINEIDTMNANDQLDMLIKRPTDNRTVYIKYLLNIIIQTSIKLNQMKLRNPLGESRQFPSKKSELLSHYPKVESPYDQLGGFKKSKRSNKSKRSKKRRSLRK